jgi:hypothetical protein
MKAYEVHPRGHEPMLYRAESAGKARTRCLLDARDAGVPLTYPDLRVRRAVEWDCVFTFTNGSTVTRALATRGIYE